MDFEKSHFKLNAKSNKGAVFVSQSEFFGRKNKVFAGANKQTKPVKTQIDTALDFSELAEGDILVHVGHGVCKYRGLCVALSKLFMPSITFPKKSSLYGQRAETGYTSKTEPRNAYCPGLSHKTSL